MGINGDEDYIQPPQLMHRKYLKSSSAPAWLLHGSCMAPAWPLKTVGKLAKLVRSVNAFHRELTRPEHDHLPTSTTEPKEELKIGLALGGGFARGMAHIGVLKAFEEAGIPIHFIAGTSVGAVIGAAYCSGVSAKELEEIASLIRFKDFARYTLSRFGLCSNDRMTGLLQRILKVRTFDELRIPLAVTATDFLTGEALILREGTLIDPVRASCAYPGVFLPVNVRGRLMVDGLLAHSVPATPLKRMGANRVVSVYFSAHWVKSGGPRHVLDVIGQCFSIAQANMSCLWQADSDLNIEPDVAEFAYDAFERSPEMIRAGEAAARSAIPMLKSWLSQSQHEVAGGDKTHLSAEAPAELRQTISAVIS